METSGKVLVLGAGRVAGPCVQFLVKKNYQVTVGSPVQTELEQMKSCHPEVTICNINVDNNNTAQLTELIGQHDVTVSLIPAHLTALVAKVCIECRKHCVSACYVDEEMRKLYDSAVEAGIVLLNECGLDPGIDHAIAMSCIDQVKSKQGEVTSLTSLCGGIPAPDSSDCPMRCKFSWYPKGMLISAVRPAKYLMNGETKDIGSGYIFSPEYVTVLDDVLDKEILECMPNGDSRSYMNLYNIQSVQSILRGTLRYKGFSKVMKLLLELGLLNQEPAKQEMTWKQFLSNCMGLGLDSSDASFKERLLTLAKGDTEVVDEFISLGLCEDSPMSAQQSPMDHLANLLSQKLVYGPGERDMVVMRTVIEGCYPDGTGDRQTVDLIDYGQVNGYFSMARTVGIPAALGAHLLLQGVVKKTGIQIPVSEEVYKPLLQTLREENIVLKFTSQTL